MNNASEGCISFLSPILFMTGAGWEFSQKKSVGGVQGEKEGGHILGDAV